MPRARKNKQKLACPGTPCASCPYRKDTPPGVWAASEYRKLPAWDEPMNFAGVFLCHTANLGGRAAVCRGWLETHERNLGVRMAMMDGTIDMTGVTGPCGVKLYKSGAEACAAGLRGVPRPSKKAVAVSLKIIRARAARP